jgi:hypothetical protein
MFCHSDISESHWRVRRQGCLEGRLSNQLVQLLATNIHVLVVGSVDNVPTVVTVVTFCRSACTHCDLTARVVLQAHGAGGVLHNGADIAAVSLPHASEAGLAAQIPHFDRHLHSASW